jgi:hypothetical protein
MIRRPPAWLFLPRASSSWFGTASPPQAGAFSGAPYVFHEKKGTE